MSSTDDAAKTLEWVPAGGFPALLGTTVAQALRNGIIDAEQVKVAEIDASLSDTAAFCEAYSHPLQESATCVVVTGKRGETVKTAVCLVLATDRADINKKARKHLDVRKLSFLPHEEAVERTQMEYGGIGPIGLPEDWPVLIDTAVAEAHRVVIGSGIRGSKIAVSGQALASLPNAQVIDLAQR